MENARQLQCKALGRLQKIHRRKNNEEQWKIQWKKQWAEQSERSEIRASACVRSDAARHCARVAATWTELTAAWQSNQPRRMQEVQKVQKVATRPFAHEIYESVGDLSRSVVAPERRICEL